MELSDLPALNATLNSLAAVCLLGGFVAIKKENKVLHKRFMVGALVISTAFLTSYLIYHFNYPSTPYPGTGFLKGLYFFILIPHILLAMSLVVLVPLTVVRAIKGNFEKHKKIARWTLPIWFYVSVTGVLVYLMLYQWA